MAFGKMKSCKGEWQKCSSVDVIATLLSLNPNFLCCYLALWHCIKFQMYYRFSIYVIKWLNGHGKLFNCNMLQFTK